MDKNKIFEDVIFCLCITVTMMWIDIFSFISYIIRGGIDNGINNILDYYKDFALLIYGRLVLTMLSIILIKMFLGYYHKNLPSSNGTN